MKKKLKDAKTRGQRYGRWKLLSEERPTKKTQIVKELLKNRGIEEKKDKDEFFNPSKPSEIKLSDVGIKSSEVKKSVERIKKAREKKEKIIVYGDYDADGICATATLWEALYELEMDVLPYIPERFSEGYGVNPESVENLKSEHPNLKLIITVDNGIVASDAVDKANDLGIDIIITDHHQRGEKLPKAHSIVHTTEMGGAGIAWIFSREVAKSFQSPVSNFQLEKGLDLCAIGTVSDQIPLLGPNRSFVKYGLEKLNDTERLGLHSLFKEAGIEENQIGVYDIGFVIAPRLNAMGRMQHAIDSLRLLCTKDQERADKLALLLGKTNRERQKVVEEVVLHAKELAEESEWESVIVLAHEKYHEGVIGLAASKLVEEYWRPAIVLSKGKTYSKASARSISGFNIIEAIRKLDDLIEGGGGHPMAAGFTIATKKIDDFREKLESLSKELLVDEVLEKTLKIDLEVDFNRLNWDLVEILAKFEPTGVGNPTPRFLTRQVEVLESRAVGKESTHLKLTLRQRKKVFDAIAFGMGYLDTKLSQGDEVGLAYRLEKNEWNGNTNLQLNVKDIALS